MKDNIPLLRRAAFAQCTSTISELGKNPDSVLSAAGIGLWHRGAPDNWVPLEAFREAMETCAATLGDRQFGITVAKMNTMRFGVVGQAITRSISLYSALRASAAMVNKLNTSASIWLAEGPDTIWFCRAPVNNNLLEQFVLGHLIGLVQMAAGDRWRPLDVRLTALDDAGLNRNPVFDSATIRTGQPCLAIALPKAVVAEEIHAGLQGYDPSYSDRQPTIDAGPEDFAGSLRTIVESALTDRYPTIEMICEILGFSKRTLQRQLAKDGLTYREILSQVRYRRACQLLAHTEMTLQEIGNALCYSQDVHFIRAFKHWAGVTPGEFRRYNPR